MKVKMKDWRRIDVEENRKDTPLLKYSPGYTDELGYYYCNLSGAQGQGNYGLCWAASAATIINYRRGSSYTAKNIADTMGIGYNSGATINQMASALCQYGLDYSAFYSTIGFGTVKSEIYMGYPFVVSGNSSAGNGHAVTAYGYRDLAGGEYVMLWNSAMNNGQGGVTISQYKSSGMTYTTGSTAYTWSRTVKANHVSYK